MFKQSLKTVALYGGSFDPPHFGHKAVIDAGLTLLDVDFLIVVPTFLNPFKSVSFFTTEERLSLSKKMFESSFRVKVNDYEIKEKKATPTSQTLVHLQQKYDVKYIILGADNLKNITQWNRFKWLNEQITWVIATRKGYEFDTSVLRSVKLLEVNVDISSTQIRKKLNDKDKYHNEHG